MTTQREAREATRALITTVEDWLKQRYAPGAPLPDGMRLEMHPAVLYLIRSDPELVTDMRFDTDPDVYWRNRFRVPVEVSMKLAERQWRLVTVTEDVHIGGEMP